VEIDRKRNWRRVRDVGGDQPVSATDRAWQIFRVIPKLSSSQTLLLCSLPPGVAMDPLPPLAPEALMEALRGRFEELCRGIAQAVNQAPQGQVINQSEEKVRDLFAELRRQAFQTALQMKVDAAEAAFPPSPGPRRPTPEEQGA
jgi:hypothetical protein